MENRLAIVLNQLDVSLANAELFDGIAGLLDDLDNVLVLARSFAIGSVDRAEETVVLDVFA